MVSVGSYSNAGQNASVKRPRVHKGRKMAIAGPENLKEDLRNRQPPGIETDRPSSPEASDPEERRRTWT